MIRIIHSRRNLLYGALLSVFFLGLIGGFMVFNQPKSDEGSTHPITSPGQIVITGEIVCLPHKGDGPHTAECAFGIHGDDNNHYGLRGLDQTQLMNGRLTVQTGVKVVGTVTPPEEHERYDIAGTIDIETIEVVEAAG